MNFAFLTTTSSTSGSVWPTYLSLILIFVIFWLFLIRPQKKREKEAQQMRSAVEIGDDIITIGGLVGTVVNMKDDTIVIETGSDRAKIRLARWSIQQNTTANERLAAEKAAAKAAKDSAKASKENKDKDSK